MPLSIFWVGGDPKINFHFEFDASKQQLVVESPLTPNISCSVNIAVKYFFLHTYPIQALITKMKLGGSDTQFGHAANSKGGCRLAGPCTYLYSLLDCCHPRFKNRPRMTFDDARAEPEQEFELHPDNTGTLEYPVKWVTTRYNCPGAPKPGGAARLPNTRIVKFSSVQHLSLHFPSNFGADSTRIYYVGLKGEFSEVAMDTTQKSDCLNQLSNLNYIYWACFCWEHFCRISLPK